MARVGRKRQGESISGYFRKIFDDRPELVDLKSNRELIDRWVKDHPGQSDMLGKVKQNLANLKSLLRKQRREAGEPSWAAPPDLMDVGLDDNDSGPNQLEVLEEQIDDCLSMAKTLDRDGLENVIRLLRRARNEVVWKIGQD